MAHARTLKNDKYHVVAVIGDGALTGGMAYEALSDAGASQEPLLVILNIYNNMSIDKNVGGMARHLARLRVSPQYLGTKNRIKNMLSHIPGKTLTAKGTKLKSAIKSVLLPVHEQMGFTYLEPVDGHDLPALSFHLQLAKRLRFARYFCMS